MSPTSIPYLCAQIQGEVTLQVGCFETNTFSSLSCVQQSHCKENGVPGVKHHTSNIHRCKWQKSNQFSHVVFLNRYHHDDLKGPNGQRGGEQPNKISTTTLNKRLENYEAKQMLRQPTQDASHLPQFQFRQCRFTQEV